MNEALAAATARRSVIRKSLDDGEPVDDEPTTVDDHDIAEVVERQPQGPLTPAAVDAPGFEPREPRRHPLTSLDDGRIPYSHDDGEGDYGRSSAQQAPLPPQLPRSDEPYFTWVPGGLDGLRESWDDGIARPGMTTANDFVTPVPSLLGNTGGLGFQNLASLRPDRSLPPPPDARVGWLESGAGRYGPSPELAVSAAAFLGEYRAPGAGRRWTAL